MISFALLAVAPVIFDMWFIEVLIVIGKCNTERIRFSVGSFCAEIEFNMRHG